MPYRDQPPAYSPRKTRAVPAPMRPMLRALPGWPMRFRVRVSPITIKPARVRMFMPKRRSLVSIGFASVVRGGSWVLLGLLHAKALWIRTSRSGKLATQSARMGQINAREREVRHATVHHTGPLYARVH